MIVTHIRTMLQAKEILASGGSAADLIRELRMMEFQARKVVGQVSLFSPERLLQAYRRLMEIDEESKGQGGKSGYADPAVLIDQFIFEFSG
jgi:DNA polymerase III delta subunit